MIWRGRGIALGALLVLVASWCRADIPPEVVARAKQATALAEVQEKDGIAEGSAFCIDATGLFVTNAHVVEGLEVGGELTLMLRSGEKDQTKIHVHVLALDTEADLAILQADGPLKFTPLTLGSSDGLIETVSVVAFGYPFGTDLALKEGDYPSITVSTGHITALRKIKGDLSAIQLDASLNPGNSGGPVLNDKGEVIAIVKEGIPGSGINNAIPVNFLRSMLARARIVFIPPASPKEHLREAQDFRVQLLTPPQGAGPVTVDLTLSADPRDHRTFHAVASPDGSGGLNNAYGMAWGPDGNLYVASHSTKEVKRYNGKTGAFIDNFVRKNSGGLDGPTGVRFGPDGMLYVSSMLTHLVLRYNGQMGAYVDDFAGGSGLRSPGMIEFGPDGMLTHLVLRYNGQTGGFVDNFIPAKSGGLDFPLGLLFAPDGKLYISSRADMIKRYDATTGAYVDNFIGGNNMSSPEHMLYRRKTSFQ